MAVQEILESAVLMAEKRILLEEMRRRTSTVDVHRTIDHVKRARTAWFNKWRLRIGDTTLWKIESRYGSAVASFFKFIKWTMLLNLASFVLVSTLVLVPELVYNEESTEIRNDSCSLVVEDVWVPSEEAPDCCSLLYEKKGFDFNTSDFFAELAAFLQDLLLGTNWMEHSPLFYGYYSGTAVIELNGVKFDFPLAYFLVMLSVFLLNLIVVVFSSAQSFQSDIRLADSDHCKFNNLIFGIWDHRIHRKKAVPIQKRDVLGKVRIALDAQKRRTKREGMEKADKAKLYSVRIAINLFVLGALGGTAYGIYILTGNIVPRLLNEQSCDAAGSSDVLSSVQDVKCFALGYIPSLGITVANVLLPFIFSLLIKMEKYEASTSLIIDLARCIFLRLASLVVAFLSIYVTVDCNYATGCLNEDQSITINSDLSNCTDNNNQMVVTACDNSVLDLEPTNCAKPVCWETLIGQLFYKLAVMDFLVQILVMLFSDVPRVLLCRKIKLVSQIQFNIGKHVLDIVFSQTICWLAVFFAPLILVVTIVKSFLLFYCRVFYVLYVCTPANIPFSATRASSLFKYFLLLAFVIVVIAVGVTIAEVQPSLGCGPFRDIGCRDLDADGACRVYDYIINLLVLHTDETLKEILIFLGETTFLIPVAFILLMIFYLVWSYSFTQAKLISQLKSELADVSKDKMVLLEELKQEERRTESRLHREALRE